MDDNGYPEKEELDKIKNWPYNDIIGLFEYCKDLWHWPDWATKRGHSYRFATGGWSGNEDIIEALGENRLAWMECWESSHRGGLHKFKIPRHLLELAKEKK